MASLNISLNDTHYAYEQMNVCGKIPFGDREWERCLATLEQSSNIPAKDSLYASMRLEFLFENERAQDSDGWAHMLTRDIITYVYAAVYSALKHNLPLVRRQDIGAIAIRYPAVIDEACAERVRKDAINLLTAIHEGWGMQFQILTANAPIDRISLFFACTCVLALLRKFSVPAEKTKIKQVPKVPRTGEERRSAALKKAEETNTILPFRSAITFDDIGGCRTAKEQLQNLARRVDQWSVVQRWGGQLPRGVLLRGPQGTGKTMLCEALATAVTLPAFQFNLSDVMSMWINQSHDLLRSAFNKVRAGGGGIMIFNEADALLLRRGTNNSHHEDEKVVNEWNMCMDSIAPGDRILVFLTTNFMDKMDDAAIRDGRIDLVITVDMPTFQDRIEVFQVHIARIQRAAMEPVFIKDLALDELARRTDGLSPASIKNIIDRTIEQKIDADLDGKHPGLITMEDLFGAIAIRRSERKAQQHRPIGFRTVASG